MEELKIMKLELESDIQTIEISCTELINCSNVHDKNWELVTEFLNIRSKKLEALGAIETVIENIESNEKFRKASKL